MPAYLIASIRVVRPESYADYVAGVAAVVARFGGRYLARGGAAERLEGGWQPRRMVVIEFPDMAAARRFHGSAEYAPLRAVRHAAAESDLVLVEGLDASG